VNARPTPWAVLGVPEGSDLETCAIAFRTRLEAAGARLVGAHAEDRPSDLASFAELVEAWRAVTTAR
jgi:hypothetical protein